MAVCEFKTTSAEETRALGIALGGFLEPGDVLVLTGDLGAGKTQLTKGIAAALGIEDEITSPTFAIEAMYEGTAGELSAAAGEPLPLYHFDLYRLDDPDQLGDAGVWDVLGGDGVCVLEWGEQFIDELGDERVDVVIERDDADVAEGEEPTRIIRFVPYGERACELVDKINGPISLFVG